jgi:vancomycin resistance protein YoaR
MTPIAAMVLELLEKGASHDVIAIAVQCAETALMSAPRPRTSADENADRRRENDRIRKKHERENRQKSADVRGNPQMSYGASTLTSSSINEDKEKKERVENAIRRVRGHRLPDDWLPSAPDMAIAIQIIGTDRTDAELEKFRDYWKAQPGQRGLKLDWPATWRNWVRNSRPGPMTAKPLTQHQIERQESREILDDLKNFVTNSDSSSGRGDADFGVLRLDSGDRQEGVYGGPGGAIVDLSPIGRSTRD